MTDTTETRVSDIEMEAEAARMSVPELLVQKLDHAARMCGYADTFSEMDALRAGRDGDCEYGCMENRYTLLDYIATLEHQRDVLLEAAKEIYHAASADRPEEWVEAWDKIAAAIAQVEGEQ